MGLQRWRLQETFRSAPHTGRLGVIFHPCDCAWPEDESDGGRVTLSASEQILFFLDRALQDKKNVDNS